jgi:hypothetical protein
MLPVVYASNCTHKDGSTIQGTAPSASRFHPYFITILLVSFGISYYSPF